MNRRDTVLALLALGAAPLIAEAQQPAIPARIAVLAYGSPETTGYIVDAFKQGMRELGYVEGKSVVFEIRWAFGKAERLPDLAKELIALKPDVILTTYMSASRAALQATATIPIVSPSLTPSSGLVENLAHPGGNITGFYGFNDELIPKQLELLISVVRGQPRVAFLRTSSTSPDTLQGDVENAAQRANVRVLFIAAKTPPEIESGFALMTREHVGAVIVSGDVFFIRQRRQVVDLASKARIAAIFTYREDAEAGGLMSYGENLSERFRRTATYVDKILKGAKPGDLPIQQATTFELVVNLKTAKALGITVPQSILIRADRVIE